MTHDNERIDSFVEQLHFKYGPADLLARFFFKAIRSAADRGVFLEFGTSADLLDVNKANPDSWLPLTTTFRQDPGGFSNENGVVFLGRNANDEVVATQAVRLFDWSQTNFKIEAESLRFFYSNPERDKAPNESCSVSAPMATEISGRVALGGAIWYRPDYRGRRLGEIIPRMARAYAYTLWNYDCLIATITQENIAKAFDKRAGHFDVTPNSMVMRHSATVPHGDLHLALARMTPMELIDDIFRFLVDVDMKVDVGVDQRRAQ